MDADLKKSILSRFEELLDIMVALRKECPWDAAQTIPTLRQYTIEETFELADAIVDSDWIGVKKELGDLLMHVVFYTLIAQEDGLFTLADVLEVENEKLIYRHPHVFQPGNAMTAREVEQQWEDLKLKEKGGNRRVLDGVPRSLPSLVKALRIQEKASAAGFDWEERSEVWRKVAEEANEVQAAIDGEPSERQEAEFGDLLFAVVNAARLYGVDPSLALERTNREFQRRFDYIESAAAAQGRTLREMTLEEMDTFWEEAKRHRTHASNDANG